MEILRSHLSKVRIPEPSNRIYKQECCVSFSTPRSEGGLFVDMCTFLAFGKEYVTWNYVKTGDPIYLNIQETPKQVSDNRTYKKPTLLAIGVEGGFYSTGPENEETYSIVILPDFISLPYPSVELPEKVRLAVDGVLAAVGEERKEAVAAWTADKKQISPYSLALQQLRNGVTVPPTGWKCSKCDKTDNLWMNLTDGTILCGRRNWDESGGNNHALEHHQDTGYPLAVKLGTITDDLEGADVYSYAEDDTVDDPLLADHLAHFGIDFSTLRKTEMTTAERELDQITNFDWNRIQEKGKELEPLFGPGFTGLSNLGNSCYLASVLQAVFSTKKFQRFYYENVELEDAFKQAPADPTRDLHMQLSKLAHGILSGKYSVPLTTGLESEAAEEPKDKNLMQALPSLLQRQDGIPPRMFKSLIGTGHPEFASSRQQDALEFFQYLLDQVERSHAADAGKDPSRCFKFCVEERIMCSVTKKVKYTWKTDNVISLNVPLRAATNKDEVAAYEKRVSEKELAGEKSDEEIVCPRVPLAACLESYSAPEEVQDFYSSAINARTTAIVTTRLATFPDYLVLHMRKSVLAASGVPRKRDVFVDVPDEIDISDMRSSGLKPDEQLLPETPEQPCPTPDQAIVSQLANMGFPRVRSEKAAVQTFNRGLEEAMNWLLPQTDDPDIDEPSIRTGSSRASSAAPVSDEPSIRTGSSRASSAAPVNETVLETPVSSGNPSFELALKALTATGGDTEKAAEWILNHPEESIAMEIDEGTGNRDTQQVVNAADDSGGDTQQVVNVADGSGSDTQQVVNVADGSGRYQLLAFVSHMGTSTQSGHYVAHVRKNDRWVIFNDNKVALSGDPPKDKGYLYFFQRIPS